MLLLALCLVAILNVQYLRDLSLRLARSPFDYRERHVTAFQPISGADRSRTYYKQRYYKHHEIQTSLQYLQHVHTATETSFVFLS